MSKISQQKKKKQEPKFEIGQLCSCFLEAVGNIVGFPRGLNLFAHDLEPKLASTTVNTLSKHFNFADCIEKESSKAIAIASRFLENLAKQGFHVNDHIKELRDMMDVSPLQQWSPLVANLAEQRLG